MTLPEDVIAILRARHLDLAKAVVDLVYESIQKSAPQSPSQTVSLVPVAPRRFLITVDATTVTHLPGCELVPFGSDTALLALESGRGLADLALAVEDRLEEPRIDERERNALASFRTALREWRRDPSLSDEARSIVVLERNAVVGQVRPDVLEHGHSDGRVPSSRLGRFAPPNE
ncbi:MAG TPA: hypothetical protein VH762_13630 [Gemmatimonadaceae bacterium]|jgi:hypothetical protein